MRHETIVVTDAQIGIEFDEMPADHIVAPIQQTLEAARNRSANRKARWSTSIVSPMATPPKTHATVRGRVLKCRSCGRSEPRSSGELKRLARGAWPMCCGLVMPPVLDAATASTSTDDPDDLPWADRRVTDRRRARLGSRAEVRRGVLGMSPDLALKLVDVSESGAQVRLVAAVRQGDQVEVALWPPNNAQSVRGPAVVCWCIPTPTGEFRAGLRLRRRLTDEVLSLLTE
jgi:PilZ domain